MIAHLVWWLDHLMGVKPDPGPVRPAAIHITGTARPEAAKAAERG